MAKKINQYILPLVPLRDIVMFPSMISPLFVGRNRSILAIEKAVSNDQQVIFVTQKDSNKNDPDKQDIYDIGVVANILQILKLPDGTIKILVEAKKRVVIQRIFIDEMFFHAEAEDLDDSIERKKIHLEALSRTALDNFIDYVQLNKKINPEVINVVSEIKDPTVLVDNISSHILVDISVKQELLSITSLSKKLDKIIFILENEMSVLNTEKKIRQRIKKQMEKVQKDYYLNEQMKAIQKELVEDGKGGKTEFEEIEDKLIKAKLPKEASEKIKSELKKLKSMNSISAEASIVRNYIDTVLALPWNKKDKVKNDLKYAAKVLDHDHYGLEKVKERILEYLAVQQRTNSLKGPIICLVGPPGVGKTSLAKSIAEATERKFVRFSMGGMRDEAEIRGHRRTYVGAMPGKIIQLMKKAKSINPVFLLDEVDKLGNDYRGDPSSALLEVLDPEQNNKFVDHYMEVEFDLSNVLFIATANNIQNIPSPLIDRMEIIRLSGYTEDEKINIASRCLAPKQKKDHGLKEKELNIDKTALTDLIRYYTRESGVRNLEKELAKISRKTVKSIIEKKNVSCNISKKNLNKFCGVRKYSFGKAETDNQIGVVTGLAYTESGGELLSIEAVKLPGKGLIKATGKLGDVMQESAQAAFSYFKSRSAEFGIVPPFYQKHDIHLHVPEGAVPKDGPSAGIAMFTAVISAMTGVAVKKSVAMTGEITLRGRVLAIGGLKEKLLAALRGGIKTAIIPLENKKDLADIPKNVTKNLKIIFVSSAEEVLKIALTTPLTATIWVENDIKTDFSEKNTDISVLTH